MSTFVPSRSNVSTAVGDSVTQARLQFHRRLEAEKDKNAQLEARQELLMQRIKELEAQVRQYQPVKTKYVPPLRRQESQPQSSGPGHSAEEFGRFTKKYTDDHEQLTEDVRALRRSNKMYEARLAKVETELQSLTSRLATSATPNAAAAAAAARRDGQGRDEDGAVMAGRTRPTRDDNGEERPRPQREQPAKSLGQDKATLDDQPATQENARGTALRRTRDGNGEERLRPHRDQPVKPAVNENSASTDQPARESIRAPLAAEEDRDAPSDISRQPSDPPDLPSPELTIQKAAAAAVAEKTSTNNSKKPAAPAQNPQRASEAKAKAEKEARLQRLRDRANLELPHDLPRDELKKLFVRFDYNGNGILSLAEIDKALTEQYPRLAKSKPALLRAYKAADATGDGLVQFAEFENLVSYLHTYDEYFRRFQGMDVNGDRRVSLEEFSNAYGRAFGVEDEADAREVFNSIDTNGGGFILFDEFCMHLAETAVDLKTGKAEVRRSNDAGE